LGGQGAFGVADLLGARAVPGADLAFARGRAGGELERTDLLARERWLAEGVVLLAGEQAPEQMGEFAGGRDGGDLGAATGADAFIERAQRPG
jgi:hypothetical protein